jgi:AcrR family transcriptional regulator
VPKAAKTPRRRLDSAAARELILDATEKRLVVVGPSGIRLQEVAADAGVSHPTVLHHFGSRELLVKAVISRSLRNINASIVAAITASAGDEEQLEAMIENVGQAFERTGHARVLLWLALEGHPIDGADVRLRDVVDATHALRVSRHESKKKKKRGPPPTWEDTARTVVLASLALVGGTVLTATLHENVGLGSDPRLVVQFRSWLSRLLLTHFDD